MRVSHDRKKTGMTDCLKIVHQSSEEEEEICSVHVEDATTLSSYDAIESLFRSTGILCKYSSHLPYCKYLVTDVREDGSKEWVPIKHPLSQPANLLPMVDYFSVKESGCVIKIVIPSQKLLSLLKVHTHLSSSNQQQLPQWLRTQKKRETKEKESSGVEDAFRKIRSHGNVHMIPNCDQGDTCSVCIPLEEDLSVEVLLDKKSTNLNMLFRFRYGDESFFLPSSNFWTSHRLNLQIHMSSVLSYFRESGVQTPSFEDRINDFRISCPQKPVWHTNRNPFPISVRRTATARQVRIGTRRGQNKDHLQTVRMRWEHHVEKDHPGKKGVSDF